MKYLLSFIAAFAVMAGTTALVRVHSQGAGPEAKGNAPAGDDHAGHDKKDAHSGHGKEAKEEKSPEWDGKVKVDLKNKTDPVTGGAIGDDHDKHAHAVFHGFQIHFVDDKSVQRFKRHPRRYMQKLELEQTLDGSVVKVDASTYVTPKLPEECPFCGMKIDADGDVYILHRGFKIFFGCWGGCDGKFLKDAAANYAHYGLVEKEGKLVKKE